MKQPLTILLRLAVILAVFILAAIATGLVLDVLPEAFAEEVALKAMKVLGILAAASTVGLVAALAGTRRSVQQSETRPPLTPHAPTQPQS